MSNTSIFQKSQIKRDSFLNDKVLNYSKFRNFDFGNSEANYVSELSPYISHRVLLEYNLISEVLQKYEYLKVEKFIQEIFWRIYWKGWLEHRPAVWLDYKKTSSLKENYKDIKNAYNGETNIDCFNEWVRELKDKNYLHNHVRMWFASIWIFTLNLPWQLGASFFLKYLFDGDAASNTLSWRWVAGLQTKGKHYLAKTWNIEKYTNNRFSNIKLNEQAFPREEPIFYPIEEHLIQYNFEQKNDYLLMFENDLDIHSRKKLLENYKNIYVLILNNNNREIKLSEKVINFKSLLVNDFKSEFKNVSIIDVNEFLELSFDLKGIDIIYPFVGENLDFILNLKNKNMIDKFNFILRKEDFFSFNFAKKGFFNFKQNIPKIIKEFNL